MKIAVTGAAGYVGSVLCEELLYDEYDVVAIDNFQRGSCDSLIPYTSDPQFKFIHADVTNEKDINRILSQVDAVIHLAAIVGFPKCAEAIAISKLINENGTQIVAQTAKKYGLKMLFASTGSVYGKVDGICTEESPLNAVSHYGITKINAEKYMFAEVPHAVAYRFATGFGVGKTMRVNLLVNDLVYLALSNHTITIFEADAKRTFFHVRNMVDAFKFGLENYDLMKDHIYNAGSNTMNASKRELAEMISKKTGCHLHYAEVGIDADLRDYVVDYGKLNNLGWKTTISLEQGINELIKVTPLLKIKHNYE